MGFSSVEKQGFLYQFAGYKSKLSLVEKEELDFCWILINALILLSKIHYVHERKGEKENWGEPKATFSETSRWLGHISPC